MSSGKVVEIIGAVVDVQFPMGSMPKVYDALKVDEANLTLKFSNSLAMASPGPSPWDPPMV